MAAPNRVNRAGNRFTMVWDATALSAGKITFDLPNAPTGAIWVIERVHIGWGPNATPPTGGYKIQVVTNDGATVLDEIGAANTTVVTELVGEVISAVNNAPKIIAYATAGTNPTATCTAHGRLLYI